MMTLLHCCGFERPLSSVHNYLVPLATCIYYRCCCYYRFGFTWPAHRMYMILYLERSTTLQSSAFVPRTASGTSGTRRLSDPPPLSGEPILQLQLQLRNRGGRAHTHTHTHCLQFLSICSSLDYVINHTSIPKPSPHTTQIQGGAHTQTKKKKEKCPARLSCAGAVRVCG